MKREKTFKKIGWALFKDAFLINLLTIGLLSAILLLMGSVSFLHPFKEKLDDFDYADIYFSEFWRNENRGPDKDIVIINSGDMSRTALARLLKMVGEQHPTVIGVGVPLVGKTGMADIFLKKALDNCGEVVLASEFCADSGTYSCSEPLFVKGRTSGFIDIGIPSHKTTRSFLKRQKKPEADPNAFAIEIMKIADSTGAQVALDRRKNRETIFYKKGVSPFIIYDFEDILSSQSDLSFLKDKWVLIGYVKKGRYAPKDLKYSHYSPLKKSAEGFPDLRNIEVQAHILTMMKEQRYVFTFSKISDYLTAFMITQLFLLLVVYMYIHQAKVFDIVTKALQFLIIVAALLASFTIFHRLGIKVNMVYTILSLALCIELMYLYQEALEIFNIRSYLNQALHKKKRM